jgi:hypothetical protein
MTRNELLNSVNNLILREKDYDTFLKLVTYATPKLFTKIYEEIVLGNLYIKDFEPIFDENTNELRVDYIEMQDKIQNQYINMYKLRKQVDESLTLEKYNQDQKIVKKSDDKDTFEKMNLAASMIDSLDTTFEKELALSLYNLIEENPDIMLASPNEKFYVAIDFNNIVIDDYDKEYMRINGLSEDEMKKIKSIANYISDKK